MVSEHFAFDSTLFSPDLGLGLLDLGLHPRTSDHTTKPGTMNALCQKSLDITHTRYEHCHLSDRDI